MLLLTQQSEFTDSLRAVFDWYEKSEYVYSGEPAKISIKQLTCKMSKWFTCGEGLVILSDRAGWLQPPKKEVIAFIAELIDPGFFYSGPFALVWEQLTNTEEYLLDWLTLTALFNYMELCFSTDNGRLIIYHDWIVAAAAPEGTVKEYLQIEEFSKEAALSLEYYPEND